MRYGNLKSHFRNSGVAGCLLIATGLAVIAEVRAQPAQLSRIDERVTDIDISGDGSVVAYSTFRGESVSRIAQHALFYQSLNEGSEAIEIASGVTGYRDISLSRDGQYLVFSTGDNALVDNDLNRHRDIFRYDRLADQFELVSMSSTGEQGNNHSDSPDISADGRYVVFSSHADNLNDDSNPGPDIFLHDVVSMETKKVSVNSLGVQTMGANTQPVISADGQFIAFTSNSSEYFHDGAGVDDGLLHDVNTGMTTHVSSSLTHTISDLAPEDFTALGGRSPSISEDGRYVAFSVSFRRNSDDHNRFLSIRLKDTLTGHLSDIAVGNDGLPPNFDTYGPQISDDGRFVVFGSGASNLVTETRENHIYITDRFTSLTELVSSVEGVEGNETSTHANLSSDGSQVVFQTFSSNLVTLDEAPFNHGGTAAILSDRTIAEADMPAPLASPERCVYFHAHEHNGWGWDPVNALSCPPIAETGCDYSQADIHDGWGWDTFTGESCPPR